MAATRLAVLLLALASWPVASIQPKDLATWLSSEDGLGLSTSAASALAGQEYRALTLCGVTLQDLQALRDTLKTKLDLGVSATVQKSLFVLAEQHATADKLYSMYYYLSSSYTLHGGLGLDKDRAQSMAISMTLARAEPDQLYALYQVMYGYKGLGLDQKTAQGYAIQAAVAGADAPTFKETYLKNKDLQKAMLMGVSANLQGLVKRYAKNGQPYTVDEFQQYYPSDWLQEWVDGPLEKKVSTDKKAYTASSFSRHFGTNWAAKYRTSDEATQVRLARDGKPYTIPQFQSYYGNSWQTEFNAAPELACSECAPYMLMEGAAEIAELVV
ncbi:unnamed protein product [Prorocentrum cordatum]|nr:unnamed protein product [Polarella glacialis]